MIGENLRTILDNLHMTMETLSSQSGVPLETIRNLFYHKAENPRLRTVLALSRALNVSIEALLPESMQPSESEDEKQLLKHYRQCSSHGRHLTRFIASMEADIALHSKDDRKTHTIPYLIPTVSSDSGSIYTTCDIRYIDISCPEAFVAICIPDNTLAPEYYQGDIILLANRFPNQNEHAVFFYENRMHLRKFAISPGNNYIFAAIHGRGKDIHLKKSSKYTLLGTCIGVLRDIP